MRLLLQQVSELLAGRPTRPRRSPYPPALFYSWRQWGVGAWCGMVGLFAVEVIALGALGLDLSVGFAAVGPAVTVAGVYALPFRDRPFAPVRAGRVIARGMGLNVGWILIGFMILGAMVLPLPGREVALIQASWPATTLDQYASDYRLAMRKTKATIDAFLAWAGRNIPPGPASPREPRNVS